MNGSSFMRIESRPNRQHVMDADADALGVPRPVSNNAGVAAVGFQDTGKCGMDYASRVIKPSQPHLKLPTIKAQLANLKRFLNGL